MNIKKWLYLFSTTLAVGVIGGILAGFYLILNDPDMSMTEISLHVFNGSVGLMFSVLAQMGFFAYLTLNYIARTMIKKLTWTVIQWFLIVVVLVDLVILRVIFFTENNAGVLGYSILPVVLLAGATVVAYMKVKMTNYTAFTPAMFFMIVVTALEAIPVLRQNNVGSTIYMTLPLFMCNAWQLLNLHRLVKSPEQLSEKDRPINASVRGAKAK